MLRRCLRLFRFRVRGRGLSWLALVGQFVGLVGLPVPRASAKDLAQPFPCQQRACGCMTASDCWKSCCCFSAGQRVAWARDHDVEVPAELVQQACCEDKEECCEHESQEAPCCRQTSKKADSKQAAAKRTSGWLLGLQASRCRGSDGGLLANTPSTPPDQPVDWQFDGRVVATLSAGFFHASVLVHPPLIPPPRTA